MAAHRYRFVADYRSGDVVYSKGQVAEFDDDHAAWMNRDVPGCIEAVDEKAERAALEAEIVAKAKAKEEKEAAKAAEDEAKAAAKAAADEEAARAVEAPPQDRMQRGAARRTGG